MNNKYPFFSLIIPVYNSEKYLSKCLESFTNQSFKDMEIVCVDDGSSDSSVSILESFLEEYPFVHIIKKEHSNAGDARNIGMQYAKGEYFCFPDSDDYVTEDFLELCHEQIEKSGCDLLAYDFFHFDSKTKGLYEPDWYINRKYLPRDEVFDPEEVSDFIFQIFGLVVNNKIISREIIEKYNIKFSSLTDANDEYAGSMALVHAKKISYVNRRIYYYRVNSGTSIQDTIHKKYSDNLLKAHRQIVDRLCTESIIDKYIVSLQNKILAECNVKLHDIFDWRGAMDFFYKCKNELTGNNALLYRECDRIFELRDKDFYDAIKSGNFETYFFSEYLRARNELSLKDWTLPIERIIGKTILLYGAGAVGKSLYKQVIHTKDVRISGWVDRDYRKKQEEGLPVTSPEEIYKKEYDCILIAISRFEVVEIITNEIKKMVGDVTTVNLFEGRRI